MATDALRATEELRDADARGLTAERAVAPLLMGGEDELETVEDGRREAGVTRGGAVVAMMEISLQKSGLLDGGGVGQPCRRGLGGVGERVSWREAGTGRTVVKTVYNCHS